MSATLRYDVGKSLVKAMVATDMFAFLGLDLHPVSRWGGHGNPRRDCECFSVSLPLQLKLAVQLLHVSATVEFQADNGTVRNGARTLAKNLRSALGLVLPFPKAEEGFLVAIHEQPDDLAHWMAYADWLSEQPGAYERKRGELIAGWLGPKPIKVKNGTLPLLAIEAERLRRAKR
jgi:uncharacterized protein (TIGR02996 family)